MNITYTRNGDYLIPNIVIRKTKPIGHYGRLRKAYLEMHRPILFNELVLSDKLFEHCAEIEEAARNRMELIANTGIPATITLVGFIANSSNSLLCLTILS